MSCRILTLADYADAHALYIELNKNTPVAGQDQFARLLNHEGTDIYGLESEGHIVSMATLHLLPNMTQGGRPYGLIENVVTLHKAQLQGHGREVMRALIEAAWQADAYKIMLLTGQAIGAKGFYEKLGFNADDKFGMTIRRVPVR